MTKIGLFLTLFLVIMVSSCTSSREPGGFDARPFVTQKYNLVLCLDLRRDLSPSAGLVVNPYPNITVGQHYVVLPFESTQAQSNQDMVSTWGSFSKFTLVTYFASQRMNSGNGLGIVPLIRIYGPDELLGNESSREPVSRIASGQDRKLGCS